MTSTGVSSRYAQALIDALASPKSGVDPHIALDQLQQFVQAMNQSRDLELVLVSPSVSSPRKRAVLARIGQAMQLDRLLCNFLFVLSDHRRLPLLAEISEIARVLLDAREGVLRADIFAAAPLSDHEQKQIAERLGAITGKQIRVEVNVDPELIGGIVARVGSTVYDGSVRGRLRAVGERLGAEAR